VVQVARVRVLLHVSGPGCPGSATGQIRERRSRQPPSITSASQVPARRFSQAHRRPDAGAIAPWSSRRWAWDRCRSPIVVPTLGQADRPTASPNAPAMATAWDPCWYSLVALSGWPVRPRTALAPDCRCYREPGACSLASSVSSPRARRISRSKGVPAPSGPNSGTFHSDGTGSAPPSYLIT